MNLLEDSTLDSSNEDEGGVDNGHGDFFNRLYASMSPANQRNHDRWMVTYRVEHWMFTHIPWMRWPVLNYVYGFWRLLFEEGVYQTCKPRWGGITFGWLNDGMKPSLWHTWQQLVDPSGPYDGLYVHGAPKNRKEADDIMAGRDPRYPNYEGQQ